MITKLVGTALKARQHKIDRYDTQSEAIQRSVLARLISKSRHTEWGTLYGYDTMRDYEQFAARVPVSDYEGLKGYIDRMRHGERDILWPGRVKWYAKSSGVETVEPTGGVRFHASS